MTFIDFVRRACGRIKGGHRLYYWLIRIVPVSRHRVIRELENNFFLVTSTGRTGTALFSKLLNESVGVEVDHEPIHREQFFHRFALEDPLGSQSYISDFRLKEISLRKNKGVRYGEVNGALRRHVRDIKNILPEAPVIHLVRNGYDVVSSILNRASFTDEDQVYGTMIPHDSIISRDKWLKFSRFEKICFMWAEENRWLSECCDVTANFESLISDYEYFREKLAGPLDIEIPESLWRKHVGEKVNVNRVYESENSPDNWTEAQHQAFQRICGTEMRKYGYQ